LIKQTGGNQIKGQARKRLRHFTIKGGSEMYVQSPAKVTDESLGARKNAKNPKDQEPLLNY